MGERAQKMRFKRGITPCPVGLEVRPVAKDGTNRGGKRVHAGGKPLPAAEKIQKGQAVRIMSNDIPDLEPAELEAVDLPEGAALQGADMPKPAGEQADDRSLRAGVCEVHPV